MAILKVATKEHADGFAKVWTHRGIAIFLDDVHKQFAVDFANITITSWLAEQQQKQAAAVEAKKIKIAE